MLPNGAACTLRKIYRTPFRVRLHQIRPKSHKQVVQHLIPKKSSPSRFWIPFTLRRINEAAKAETPPMPNLEAKPADPWEAKFSHHWTSTACNARDSYPNSRMKEVESLCCKIFILQHAYYTVKNGSDYFQMLVP